MGCQTESMESLSDPRVFVRKSSLSELAHPERRRLKGKELLWFTEACNPGAVLKQAGEVSLFFFFFFLPSLPSILNQTASTLQLLLSLRLFSHV